MSSAVSVDPLDVLGVSAGVFLVLVGLGTLVGTPWVHAGNTAAAVGKIVGALAAIAVGGGLAWFLYTTE